MRRNRRVRHDETPSLSEVLMGAVAIASTFWLVMMAAWVFGGAR